jgi:hypothetical protein
MSVEGIRSIIRRHTGLHPAETGPIPHSEVTAMIASAKDGDGITSRERVELLAAVAMFGDTAPGRPSLLSPADEAALKAATISGIETLDLFLGQSRAKQESFIVYCVLQRSAEYIGFTQFYTPPAQETQRSRRTSRKLSFIFRQSWVINSGPRIGTIWPQ